MAPRDYCRYFEDVAVWDGLFVAPKDHCRYLYVAGGKISVFRFSKGSGLIKLVTVEP